MAGKVTVGRSGVILAMRHRLSRISTYRLNGLGKGYEHPAYTPLEYYDIFLCSTGSNSSCSRVGFNVPPDTL